MTWERARQPEQIEQRRGEILQATARLYADKGVDGTSLSAIAREAKISKANIYRYFESREAIFLQLLVDDLGDWVRSIEAALAPLAGQDDTEAFVEAFVENTAECDRLLALVSSLSSVLEQNVSAEAVRTFKRGFMALSQRVINAIHAALPSLAIADCMRFFSFFVSQGTGLYASAHPPPHVEAVMNEPEFAVLQHDFKSTLKDHARVLLRGLAVGPPAN